MKKLLEATLIATTMLTTACTRVTDAETGIRQTFSGEIVDQTLHQGLHQIVFGDVIKVSKRNLVLNVESQPIVCTFC